MKIPFKPSHCRSTHAVHLAVMVWVLLSAVFAANESAFAADKGKDADRIQIKSDSLVAYNEESYAEFIGNVSAVQGTTRITADKLRIYYSKSPENKGKPDSGQESVKKVVATGNVVIHSENRAAYTSTAEYTPATKVIVLSGPGSKITSGDNFVTGDKITFLMQEDRVTVERGKDKQVEAVFYSGELEKKP